MKVLTPQLGLQAGQDAQKPSTSASAEASSKEDGKH